MTKNESKYASKLSCLSEEADKILNSFNYEDICVIESYLREIQREKRQSYFDAQEENYQKRQKQEHKRRNEFKKTTLPKIRKFLTEAPEGCKLKVAGCRDGHGHRIFLSYDAKNCRIECRQILDKGKLGQITEHMDDKVRAYWDERNKQWIKFK